MILEKGLSTKEAQIRLREFGENSVLGKKKQAVFLVFLKKFNSPLLWILIAVSILSFFMKQKTNGIIVVLYLFLVEAVKRWFYHRHQEQI